MHIAIKLAYSLLSFLFPFGAANIAHLNLYSEEVNGEQSGILPYVFVLCLFCSLLDPKVRRLTKELWVPYIVLSAYICVTIMTEIFYGLSGFNYTFFIKLIVGGYGSMIIGQTFIAHPNLLKESLIIYAVTCISLTSAFYAGFLNNSFYFSNGRLWFLGINPNTYSFMIGIAVIILTLFEFSNKFFNFLRIPSALSLLYFMLLLGSRGSIIFLALALIIIYGGKKVNFFLIVAIIAIAMATIPLLYEYEFTIFERFEDFKGSDSREDLIKKTLSIYEESPLFGIGPSGYREKMLSWYNENRDSHNILITSLATSGIVGTLFLSLLLFLFFKISIFRSYWRRTSFAIFILVFLMSMKSGYVITFSQMWYLYGVVISLNYNGRLRNNLQKQIV